MKHGATVKQCSHRGCTNQVQRNGLCRRHGAYKRTLSPNEANEQDNGSFPPLPPLLTVELRAEAPRPKRPRTSTQSKRTRATSPRNRQANASALQSTRVASKRKATKTSRNVIYSDQEHGQDPEQEPTGVDQDTSTKRRRNTTNDTPAAAAETLLSFASGSTTFNDGDSTDHDDSNIDLFHHDDDATAGTTEPQNSAVNPAKVTLESLPNDNWDDSPLSPSPSISKFLTNEEVNNVRLVSTKLHLDNPAKRLTLRVRVRTSKSSKQLGSNSTRLFLERARKFLGPAKELFNRSQVEFVGSTFINSCRNFFCGKTGKEQGFFQYTNCLDKVKGLTLLQPDDYTILHSLGDLTSLERLCVRGCDPPYMKRPCRINLRSSYESQDYGGTLKNVGYVELIKCSLPHLLLRDLVQSASQLKGLKIRRCRPENIEYDNSDDFFAVLSNLSDLEEFKFVPANVLWPSATVVVPTEEYAAREGLFLDTTRDDNRLDHRNNDEEMDDISRLSTRMLTSVCNNNEGLLSLSMRNVELLDGVGIKPLMRLKRLEKICLCALTSFEEHHLQLLYNVGKDTLRKLSLVHCRLIEGHLDHLVGLRQLEELSLLATTLCNNDIEALSNMRQLKVLNVSGQIQNDCDLSQLQSFGNLRHLSLQIYNKVLPGVAQHLNSLSSLESLCLRMRFLGVHEMDTDDQVSYIPVDVDEESTLNFSVGTRMDIDDATVNDDEVQQNIILTEESPFDFSGLHSLRSLMIHDSILTDDLVESISHLHQLEELSLWDCHALSEESISHLATMQSLKKLCLHRFDAMSESSLQTLSRLNSIKELGFYQCGIMHNVEIDKNNLGSMRNLRKLTISPYDLEKPTNLTHVQLIKDESERNAKKRVAHLLRKILTRGLF